MTNRIFAEALALAIVLAAAPALAAPAVLHEPPRVLVVSGHGEMSGTPDEATVSAGVVTEAKTAADAFASNARAMTQVFAALKQAGVPDKNIRTENFTVSPQYPPYNANSSGGERTIVGYQVSNEVTVNVEHIDNLGPTIDALAAAGANQMNGIAFSIHDSKALLNDARAKAVDDASEQAEVLARSAHVALGPIVSIESGLSTPRPIYPLRAMAEEAVASTPTPIAAGEQTVSADVTITWAIK